MKKLKIIKKLFQLLFLPIPLLFISSCSNSYEKILKEDLIKNEEQILDAVYSQFFNTKEYKNGQRMSPPMQFDKVYVYCLNTNDSNVDLNALKNEEIELEWSDFTIRQKDIQEMITNNIPIVQMSFHWWDPLSESGNNKWVTKTYFFPKCKMENNTFYLGEMLIGNTKIESIQYFPYFYDNIEDTPTFSGWLDLNSTSNSQKRVNFNGEIKKLSDLVNGGSSEADKVASETPAVEEVDITIGKQIWQNKNLDVITYRNGDTIPQVQDANDWEKLTTGAWCYYENKTALGKKFGKLYNWYAVIDSRGLAPAGYHIPTDEEWTILTDHLGGESVAGSKMKSSSGWQENGSNSSGFNGLPGGCRELYVDFCNIGGLGVWWSSTEFSTSVWCRSLNELQSSSVERCDKFPTRGCSVRCLRD